MLLLVTIPLIVVMVRAIDAGLAEQLSQPTVTQAIKLSLATTMVSVLLMTILGTPLAYWLARGHVPARPVIETLLDLPIVLPPAVAGIALLMTFGRRGVFGPILAQWGITLPFTTIAVVMAQVFVAAPFFIRSAQTGFVGVSREIEEGASDLGADAWHVFRRVTFPLAGPALLSGVILSGARALGEFGATILFAGNFIGRTQTMPLAIYQTMESDLGAALAVAAVLVLISFGFLFILRLITRGRIAHPLL
ncbi:MAG: molybdate ABC transporter permease subunit [Chloroflexi bacterium]|nr:molybdate ABC transporter permease subunit [Chloroflexota bacterium]